MSFRMLTDDPFDITGFKVIPSSYSPETGIKINVDGTYYYQKYNPAENTDKLLLRFTDATASKDANLQNVIVSTGQQNTENPSESTYKQYNLTPAFKPEINNYTITLLEYIDTMDITAVQSDTKATMKIKIPEHDADGNLIYESDGTTITYKEENLSDNVPFGVTLNKLGERDTKITILVTAEDGQSTNEYEVLIKRPYGTITGKIQTNNINDIHIGTIKVYKAKEIIWEDYYVSHNNVYTHDDLPIPIDYVQTEQDGTFSIKLIPGKYDIMIDKACYFDHIIRDNEVLENQTENLNIIDLVPGDINKDGMINAKDFNSVKLHFGENFQTADINESGTVDARDFNAVKLRFGQSMEIY